MTRPAVTVVVLGLIAGVGRPASADDLVFGADGIPYLVARSSLIVRVEAAERRPARGDARMIFFEVRAGERLKGEIEPGGTVTVALRPEVVGAATPPDIPPNSLLFLSGPLQGEQAQRQGIDSAERPIHVVVSGRYGVWTPDAQSEQRLASLRDYLELREKAGVQWAQKYLESNDRYLQRSALLEVSNQPAEDPEVIAILSDALKSDQVTPTNKDLAVHSLEICNSPRALGPLLELSRSPNAPRSLRTSALDAIGSLPGGRDELRQLERLNDPFTAPGASEVLRKLQEPAERRAAPPETIERIRNDFIAKDSATRRQALDRIRTLAYSDQIGDVLTEVLSRPQEPRAVKQAALEALAGFNTRAAAEELATFITTKEQPVELRIEAIMAIARMETGVGTQVLNDLTDKLEEPELKTLAEGLAEGR